MEKKEYIERGAVIDAIEGTDWYHISVRGNLAHGAISDGNALYKADDVFEVLNKLPAADVVEVVHGDAEREYVESLLKRHGAYLLAKIDNTGTHVGKFEDITLDADGNWIIEADVESLSVTDCGDFAPVVRGEWEIVSESYRLFDDYDEAYFAKCPFCDRTYYVPFEFEEEKMIAYAREHYPFCHCGAKMDGGNRNADA